MASYAQKKHWNMPFCLVAYATKIVSCMSPSEIPMCPSKKLVLINACLTMEIIVY